MAVMAVGAAAVAWRFVRVSRARMSLMLIMAVVVRAGVVVSHRVII